MRAIGLDLGTKTLGIAITDSLKIIATGLENFEYSNWDLNICVNKIKQIFEKYSNDIDTIVLGKSKRSNDKPSEMTLLSDEFKRILEQNFKNVKVVQWNEAYSTINTTEMLKYQAGLKASKIKKIKDKMSAVYILQDYLDNGF